MRSTPLLFLVLASCTARGANFRAEYGGKCRAENAQFAPTVTQSGPVFDALRARFIDALNHHDSELRRCYTEALANQPTTRGRFVLRVLLGADGRVRNVVVPADTTGFPELACCVATIVQGLQLTASGVSGDYGFDYPFIFRTIFVASSQPTLDYVYTTARKDGCEVVLDGSLYLETTFQPEPADDASHLTQDHYAAPGDPLK
jgi:hypothetical protein